MEYQEAYTSISICGETRIFLIEVGLLYVLLNI